MSPSRRKWLTTLILCCRWSKTSSVSVNRKMRLGHAQHVARRLRHARLEVAHDFVGQVADGAAREARQPGDGHRLEARQLRLDREQRVARAAVAADACAAAQRAIRLRADEAVARQALAALHALEQEGVAPARHLQVRRDRRLEVGRHLAVEGAEVALGDERARLFQGGVEDHDLTPTWNETSLLCLVADAGVGSIEETPKTVGG